MKTRTLVLLAAAIVWTLMVSGSEGRVAAQNQPATPGALSVVRASVDVIPGIQFLTSTGERPPTSSPATFSLYASSGITETVDTAPPDYPGTPAAPPVGPAEDQEYDSKREASNSPCAAASDSLAPEDEGGPDLFGYTFVDSNHPDGPAFDFVDISTTGTPVQLSDDSGSGPHPIGFDFAFYDQIKREFYISSNGFISFNSDDLWDYGNDCPILSSYTPDDTIAIYWTDLNPSSGDLAYYENLDPCPYTGHGACLVVQYEDYHYFGGAFAGTFQGILFEDGDILVQFADINTGPGYGSTIGIEDSTHTSGLTYACDDPGAPYTGLAVLFLYPSGLNLNKSVDDVLPAPGQRLDYTLVIRSLGEDSTQVVVSDTLPDGLSFAGPVTMDPPQPGAKLAQVASDLPILASEVSLPRGASVTLSLPVIVDRNASGVIVNSAAVTSAEFTEPEVGSTAITVIGHCNVPSNPIVNCSFETGSLSGWVAQDIADPIFPLQAGGAGIDLGYGAFVSDPTHGDYAALHGFDGRGPGTIELGQDVTLPPGYISLEFLYRAGWDLVSYDGYQDRHFVVQVEPSGGGPYPYQSTVLLTAPSYTIVHDTGKLYRRINLSDFAGQSVRISFEWDVPQTHSGPAFFQLDNVFVRVNEPPSFTSVPVVSATEDVSYTYQIAAADSDPEEQLVFTAPSLPSWLELVDHGDHTATLSGVPLNADVGSHNVELRVENSLSVASTQTFVITVENVNDPPAFTSTPALTALRDGLYTYEVSAVDEDAGETLTITASTLPAWLSLTDRGDGTATLAGTPSQAGRYDVTLAVTDGTAQAVQSFSITVHHTQLYLPLVFDDYDTPPEQVSILAWIAYTDYYEEYYNSIAAIHQLVPDYTLEETSTLSAATLQAALEGQDVLLIPEQEYEYCSTLWSLGESWSAVLEEFLQQGGTLIVMDYAWCEGSSYCLLEGAGLLDVDPQGCGYYTGDYTVIAVEPSHPLLQDIPSSFQGEDGTLHFSSSDATVIAEEALYGNAVVLAKDVGEGHLALFGFDFFYYNDTMARLLANAVLWR